MFAEVKKELKDVYRFRYVVYSYVETFLKLRYRRSYLGFAWTVLAPMIHYVVIGLVFSLMMRGTRPDYFTYYFSGAVFFGIISGIFNRSMMAMIGNEHFIKKIYIPKILYVLQAVTVEFANFFLSAAALILLGLVTGHLNLNWYLPLMFVPIFLLFFMMVGLAAVISVLTVYFRDFMNIIPAALQALFFATPIIYDENMLPSQYHWIFKYNPFYYFLVLFRTPLLEGTATHLNYYLYCTGMSFISCFIGILVIKHFDNKIVFKL